ncbi:MAG: thymidylate synthase [Oscillospiraceae bacterium]|jgi:thymidylate synthase|nr:thymidylate synthase [Oscillospiraceae bacterium]
MDEILISGKTLPEAYHSALVALSESGKEVPCPDYGTNQKEISLTMIISDSLGEPLISRLFPGGHRALEQYRQEILFGILDFEVARGNWHYTYHDRIAAQIPQVIQELRRNPYSRRAVIDARRIDDDWAHDSPACLQHLQYFIRGGKLHSRILFRSNDAVKATFMNAFALIMLQSEIAGELGVGVGSYSHRANSFHVYQKDFDTLDVYCRKIKTMSLSSLTYEYEGDWKILMEEEQPSIAAMTEELRNR